MHDVLISLQFVFILINSTLSARCDSFNQVKITVKPTEGKSYVTTIDGCIERIAFDKTIAQASIKNETVPKLGTDSVRHLRHLDRIVFDNCYIAQIEAQVFRNVPKLRIIEIVNNNFQNLPKEVFQMASSLEDLILSNNMIRTIEDGAFADLPSLKKIVCQKNQLGKWRKEWFTNSSKIEWLDFQRNQIKIVPKGAFSSLPKLKIINFNFNNLEVIEVEAFKGLKMLDYLGFKYNKLKAIDGKIFPDMITIRAWQVEANHLNFLPQAILDKITVMEFTGDGNPWICPCFHHITDWLHHNNATLKKSEYCKNEDALPICSNPSDSSNCVEAVDEEAINIYLEALKMRKPQLHKYCARLD